MDRELVHRLVEKQFPEWADLPITFVQSSGTVNLIYRLGEELCVKLPRTGNSLADLERELAWLPRLSSRLSLLTPVPVARGAPDEGYPFPWAVFQWLPGENLEPNDTGALPDTGRRLAAFVTELGALDDREAPRSSRDAALSADDPLVVAAFEVLEGVVDVSALRDIWERALGVPVWRGPHGWTHGDLIPPNLLARDGRLSAVIDFGLIGTGDPAVDLIPAWAVLRGKARTVFREATGADEFAWQRARGYALRQALRIVPYYRESKPSFAGMAIDTIREIIVE